MGLVDVEAMGPKLDGNLVDVVVGAFVTRIVDTASRTVRHDGNDAVENLSNAVRDRLGGIDDGRQVVEMVDRQPDSTFARSLLAQILTREMNRDAAYAQRLRTMVGRMTPTQRADAAAAGAGVSNQNTAFASGSPDRNRSPNGRYLWIAVIAVVVLLGGGITAYQLVEAGNSTSGGQETDSAAASINLAGADACNAIRAEQQQSLSIADGRSSGRPQPTFSSCKYKNTRLGTDLLVTYNTDTTIQESVENFTRDPQNQVSSAPLRLGDINATQFRVTDPEYRHNNCFVALDVQPRQVLVTWASDIGGDDATMPQLCDNAEAAFRTIMSNY